MDVFDPLVRAPARIGEASVSGGGELLSVRGTVDLGRPTIVPTPKVVDCHLSSAKRGARLVTTQRPTLLRPQPTKEALPATREWIAPLGPREVPDLAGPLTAVTPAHARREDSQGSASRF